MSEWRDTLPYIYEDEYEDDYKFLEDEYAKLGKQHNVFVYGTLRAGEWNHYHYLKKNKAQLIAVTKTQPGYVLFCPRAVPYVVHIPGATSQVVGEVYSINKRTLRRLDDLEGHPFAYERKMITTECGLEAWIYLSPDEGIVLSGDYKTVKKPTVVVKKTPITAVWKENK